MLFICFLSKTSKINTRPHGTSLATLLALIIEFTGVTFLNGMPSVTTRFYNGIAGAGLGYAGSRAGDALGEWSGEQLYDVFGN